MLVQPGYLRRRIKRPLSVAINNRKRLAEVRSDNTSS